jgi:hypothetical protein
MRATYQIVLAAIALGLVGCAANSSVAPTGPDSFMVSRQAATGFSGSGTLKAEALSEAGQYCTERGKVLYVTNTTEAQPPYVLGNFPKAEVQFMCLAANDPRAALSRKP